MFLRTFYAVISIISINFVFLIGINPVIYDYSVDASIVYVDPTGSGHYVKIQDAIDNSNPGDTIVVANGTYYESITINRTNINLIGNSSINCKIIFNYMDNNHSFFLAYLNFTNNNMQVPTLTLKPSTIRRF